MKTEKRSNRFLELEGLRGIAALSVVIGHALSLFYMQMLHGQNNPAIAPVQHMRFEDNLYANPIAALWSGTFAVAIFFVLSGFVLSIGFLQTGKVEILKRIAAKRYPRLMLPALASVLICYVLISLNFSSMQAAASIIQSDLLAKAWDFTPSLLTAIKDGAIGVFFRGETSYNPVLWTMTIEFLGSFIVFSVLLLFSASKYRSFVYAALLVATFNTWFFAFIVGMIFADLYKTGKLAMKKQSWYLLPVVFAVSLYFGGYPYGNDLSSTVYAPLSSLAGIGVDVRMMSLTAGAIVLVLGVLMISRMAALFSQKYMLVLGKYSFSLYLIHMPILWIVTTAIFVELSKFVGYNMAVAGALFVTIPIVWGATYVFAKAVDFKAVNLSSYLADVYLGRRTIALRENFVRLRLTVIATVENIKIRIARTQPTTLDNEVE